MPGWRNADENAPPRINTPEDGRNSDNLVRVPVGKESEKWRTVQFERTVLMVIRTATTFVRLIQIAEHLLSDTRIQVLFTISDGRSVYARNLENEIIQYGCVYIPWQQAKTMSFDLAISASMNGPLAEVKAPLLLLSHGPGHTKNISIPDNSNSAWATLVNSNAQRHILALANNYEGALFPASFEKVVIGDPMLDAILAAQLKRNVFRKQLGIRDRKLIVLSSTWGASSSFARMPDFAAELLRRLPADEYTIASILHPNIWIGHGSWQVRVWYRDAVESGMILVPYNDAWQAVIAAADIVMGDHGSVTLYANIAGIPVARLSYAHSDMKSKMEVVSAIEKTPIVNSIEEAVSFAKKTHFIDKAAVEETRNRSCANIGTAALKLFGLIYDILGIPPSNTLKEPYELKLETRPHAPRSYFTLVNCATSTLNIKLFPAAVGRSIATNRAVLISQIDESNYRILQSCRVVICDAQHASVWKSICPSAHYALLSNADETILESRSGEFFTVHSNLDNPIVTSSAALYLISHKTTQSEFSCGSGVGHVSVCHQAPNSRNLE